MVDEFRMGLQRVESPAVELSEHTGRFWKRFGDRAKQVDERLGERLLRPLRS
jgi:hypothetical protein